MTNEANETGREQWAVKHDEHRTDFAPTQKPLKYQLFAWALWITGAALEFCGILAAAGVLRVPFLSDVPVLTVALVVVVGLIAVLAAQRMWKRAASLMHGKKQGVLGVAMACFAFVPMCLFFLVSKNAPAKTKAAALCASLLAALLIAALCWLVPGDPAALYGAAQ